MVAAPHNHVPVWSARMYLVRIAIGVVLAMLTYGALCVWVPYQQEQRIAREIVGMKGTVQFTYIGPKWVPDWVREKFPCFDRIVDVNLGAYRQINRWSRGPMSAQVTDEFLKRLGGLPKLNSLSLHGQRSITEVGIIQLKSLPGLQHLNLSETNVLNLKCLKELSNLESLYLHGTGVTDAGLRDLHELPNLKELSLDGTTITDAGLAYLVGLSKLRTLSISQTEITDAGVQHIAKLDGLELLIFRDTHITYTGRLQLPTFRFADDSAILKIDRLAAGSVQ